MTILLQLKTVSREELRSVQWPGVLQDVAVLLHSFCPKMPVL
jgi:hypothetical protein